MMWQPLSTLRKKRETLPEKINTAVLSPVGIFCLLLSVIFSPLSSSIKVIRTTANKTFLCLRQSIAVYTATLKPDPHILLSHTEHPRNQTKGWVSANVSGNRCLPTLQSALVFISFYFLKELWTRHAQLPSHFVHVGIWEIKMFHSFSFINCNSDTSHLSEL